MRGPTDATTYYNSNKNSFAIFHPKSFDDVESAISMLRDQHTIIVYLDKLKAEDAQRVLDLLSGAVFALNGNVFEMQKDIFMMTSSNVDIISDT